MRMKPFAYALGALVGLGLHACASEAPAGREGDGAGVGASAGVSAGVSSAGMAAAGVSAAGVSAAGVSAAGVSAAGVSAAGVAAAGMGGSAVDCTALTLPAEFDDVISTFEDGTGATNQVEGRGGGFYMFNDMSGGTQDPPTGGLPPARMEQRCDSQYSLCMSGNGFTVWGAGMGTDLGPTAADMTKMPFDASVYKGISFWAKVGEGSTPVVRVSLKDGNTAPEGGVCDSTIDSGEGACNDDWGKSLNLSKEWKPYTIMFDEMTQAGWGAAYPAFDQSKVYGFQLQVSQNLDFDVCIDDLFLVR